MNGVNDLKDVLDYIDIGITDNNNKTHYILYISMIHNFFLNWEGIDFGIRYDVRKQANLIITKLIDHENGDLKDDWLKMKSLIVPALIEKDKELVDDDRYFSYRTKSENKNENEDEDKYNYKLPIFRQNSSE